MIWVLITAIMGTLMTTMATRGCDEGEMIPLLKRHEIQVLLKAGFSVSDVAERSATSTDTVRRVQREDAVEHTDDRAARAARRVGRPSKAAPFATRVSAWLADEPTLPTQELLRRAKETGYTGNKTAFYALVAGLRPPRATPVVRFEGLPGEFSQHDFGQVEVRYVDGRKQRVHFFVSLRSTGLAVLRPLRGLRTPRLALSRETSSRSTACRSWPCSIAPRRS